MLAATWSRDGFTGVPVERYEWSAGDFSSTSKQPKGIFNAAVDQVWFDVGQETSAVLMLDDDKLLTPTFLYYFFVRAWYSDSSYAIYRSDGITLDTRPPDVTSRTGIAVKEHINESSTIDTDFLTETDHVSISWWYVFRDESGGLSQFEVSLSTFPEGEDIESFQVLPGNVEQHTFRNLDLKNGQRYYSNVRAYNHAGLHTLVVSDGFVVDLQLPVAGMVLDGNDLHDIKYQSSPAVVKTSWLGFVDFESFTSYFESCIGETDDPEECRVKEWQRVKIGNSVTSYLSRNLTTGLRYFAKVRSYDAAGHVSLVSVSDGFIVDTTPPEPLERVYYGENIIQNPSFEESPHSIPWSGQLEDSPQWIVSKELLPNGWSLINNSSLVVYTAEHSHVQDGTYFIVLQGGLTQSVKTTRGHHYILMFYTKFVTSSSVPLINQEGSVQAPGIRRVFKLYNKDNGNHMHGGNDVWQKHVYFFTADTTESKIIISTVSLHGMMMADNITISSYSYNDDNKNSATVTADGAIHFQTQFIHDWSSIHAIWHFFDPESPIVDYTWAIGTVPGGTQVQGFKSVGTKREGLNTEVILQNGVQVYVTVVSTNAAGLATRVISAPLTIDLTEPVVDFVHDGAEEDDIDYQTDQNLVVTWSAFDAQSGIYLCEWAIGLNPLTDDIQEFRPINCDDGFGIATVNDTLYENVRLFSTIRVHNNAGMSTTYNSDGIVIVTRPPITDNANVRVLITSQSSYTPRGYYQSDTRNLAIAWNGFYDPVKITRYECCVGTNNLVCTGRWIACGLSDDTQTRIYDISLAPHTIHYVFVRAVNQVNMTSDSVVTEFITETLAPVVVDDIEITWPHDETVKLDWEGTFQANSSLMYELTVGTQAGASDIVQWLETSEVAVVLNNMKELVDYFVALTAVNCAGLHTTVNATFYQKP
ncbi:uncharacterized protein LOC117113775 [Anneissia japonica]|uniref:uncharacterized protein LOC117113775 n=1 Tax=Anneissia japonica TaxID=1529436 RepID=UPI00142595F6|nr:uncharacterized protein LOC117113775 [Anneissia japonica]